LWSIIHWAEEARPLVCAGAKRNRQQAFHGSHGAGQCEFTDDDEVIKLIGFELVVCRENAKRNRQVEARSFLAHVGGREIDREATNRESKPGIRQRRDDAVLGFLHRGVGQADDQDLKIARASVGLNFNWKSLDAVYCCGTNFGEHRAWTYHAAGPRTKSFCCEPGFVLLLRREREGSLLQCGDGDDNGL